MAKKSPLRPLHFSEVGRLLQGDYADTLRVISREGESALRRRARPPPLAPSPARAIDPYAFCNIRRRATGCTAMAASIAAAFAAVLAAPQK